MVRIAAFLLMLIPLPLQAEEALVAVASNFLRPAEILSEAYEAESGHVVRLAGGSTGQHYAQILHGAPYDVFLAADQKRPSKLTAQGLAGSPVTYAEGRLAWVSSMSDPATEWFDAIEEQGMIAIANPKLAPFGWAAEEVLRAKGLWDQTTVVLGQNVGQAFAMVASGSVRGGLVALSQVQGRFDAFTVIPSSLHSPILQDAVLLTRAKGNLAAEGFLAYLVSDEAQAMIESFGYDIPDPAE